MMPAVVTDLMTITGWVVWSFAGAGALVGRWARRHNAKARQP